MVVLAQAERRAARIYGEAGVYVVWNNCSSLQNHVGLDALVRADERSSPGVWGVDQPNGAGLRAARRLGAPAPTWSGLDCTRFEWPTRLGVRIMHRSARSTSEVFGVAFLSAEGTGCYSDVFFDEAMNLHADWNVSLPEILGGVMAHELGHLLLGSNSHSRAGIMRAHWQGEELNLLSRGNLRFTSEQGEHMRGKLSRVRSAVALAARSSF